MTTRCMCSALRMAARRMTQIYDSGLAPADLNTAQFALLSALAGPDGVPTVNELADRLALDRTTLAHNLRPLERDGLVEVTVDAQDRRMRRIVLTEAGRLRRRVAEPLWTLTQARFEADYGADRAQALREAALAIAQVSRRNETRTDRTHAR